MVVHDLAYADLVFDGYEAPSFLQVPGAKDVGVEFFSLSKSYNMPGWRVGFCVGNRKMIAALARIKSYLDYGIFQPIQIAAIQALNGPQDYVEEIRRLRGGATPCRRSQPRRLDGRNRRARCSSGRRSPSRRNGLARVLADILLREAKVAVSPGIGFGEYGDGTCASR